MKRIIVISLIFTVLIQIIQAQQEPMYSQYMFNHLAINPACAGTSELLEITALARNQWLRIPGAPVTQTLSVNTPVTKKNIGLGFTLLNDRMGESRNTSMFGDYSYHIKLPVGTIAMGLKFGVSIYKTMYTDVDYTLSNTIDPAFESNFQKLYPSVGGGAYFFTDRYYAGISMPGLLSQSVMNKAFYRKQDFWFDHVSHYFITGGYIFDINSDIKFRPSTLIKYVRAAPMEIDLNAVFWFYNMMAAGISYRSKDAINAIFEVQANQQICIGYAFDYSTTDIRKVNAGSHEFMIRYIFNYSKAKIVSPRYF